MKITNGFFDEARRITTLGQGAPMAPRFIVIHYTAGSSISGAVATLEKEGYSYNLDTSGNPWCLVLDDDSLVAG